MWIWRKYLGTVPAKSLPHFVRLLCATKTAGIRKHGVVTSADSHDDSSRIKVVGALLFRIVMEKPMTTVYVLCSEVRVRVYVDDVEMLICDQKNSWCSRAKMCKTTTYQLIWTKLELSLNARWRLLMAL